MMARVCLAALLLVVGCAGGGDGNDDPDGGGNGGTSGSGGAGSGGTGAEGCVTSRISNENVDSLDLLFVVDNSESMIEEQASLRVQMPRLIAALTVGRRSDGASFPAVRDLHLGVISTDMGLPGVPGREALGCGSETLPLGDDGVLNTAGNAAAVPDLTCDTSYPSFITFQLSANPSENQTMVEAAAHDFACVSALGTGGCGFEMPLEAMLRALWPSDNVLPNGQPGVFADGRPFFDGSMFGKSAPLGPNTGFLRNSINEGQSVVAVVVVTDEDDCSSHTMGHFVPNDSLQAGDPLRQVPMNLRCFNEAQRLGQFPVGDVARDEGNANLYAVARYAEALKALRPDNPNRVIFAAITGIPTDLIARAVQIDFSDFAARSGYYDSLLNDPRMIEAANPNNNTDLIPSCLRTSETVEQRSVPPRRLVKVAKAFGENAVLDSICSDDFTPAINRIIDKIAGQLGPVCLPQTYAANGDGVIGCRMMWELPLPGTAPAATPTTCADAPAFLSAPPAGERQLSNTGRPLCVVSQVAVTPCSGGPLCANGFQPNQSASGSNAIDGWYYDNFSDDVASCPSADKQRIAFTSNPGVNVQPPIGVTVQLTCADDDVSSCF